MDVDLERGTVEGWQPIVRAGLGMLAVLLTLLVGLLVWRRAAGGFNAPLDAGSLFVLGGVLASAWGAMLACESRLRAGGDWRVLGGIAGATVMLLVVWSVSIPGTGWLGIVGLAALPAVALLGGALLPFERVDSGPFVAGLRGWIHAKSEHRAVQLPMVGTRWRGRRAPRGNRAGSSEVIQRLVRRIEKDGSERIEAELTVRAAAGERVVQAHVAFCPPLARLPDVEVEQVSGPSAELRIGQRLAHGVRVECKLTRPMRKGDLVRIRLTARSKTGPAESQRDETA